MDADAPDDAGHDEAAHDGPEGDARRPPGHGDGQPGGVAGAGAAELDELDDPGGDELDGDELGDDGGSGGRRRRMVVIGVAVLVVLGLGLGLGFGLTGGGAKTVMGPEGVPLVDAPDLAPAAAPAQGKPVGNITCTNQMSIVFHIHTHVAIFVNGKERRLPAGAGIKAPRQEEHLSTGLFVDNSPTSCLYWLHVHANDDIVHIEAPAPGQFTLGQFFDVWGQPLGPDQVGPAKGKVTAFVDGKVFQGNPRNIPFKDLEVVQLDVGEPVVPFKPLKFKVIGLCEQGVTTCALPPGS